MYAMITKEIVNEALQMGNTKIHNAIISLMYTSSLDKDIIVNLKIEDLIKACGACFNEDEDQTIDVLLSKDTYDMYPCWVLDSGDKHRVTFNTPVASYYLFDYLKENTKYYDLDSMDFIFKIKHKGNNSYDGINERYISNLFNKKATPLKELKITPSNFKFTPRMFIESFKKICEECLDIDDKSELINLFIGNATDDNNYYKQYLDNPTSILTYYKELLPDIELSNVMSVQKQVISKPIVPAESIPSKKYDDKIISAVSNYYNNHIKDSSITHERYMFLTDYVYDIVVTSMNLGILNDISKINFDELFKRAAFAWALKQYPDDVSRDIDKQFCKNDLFDAASILNELDIKDIPIFPDLFVECLDEIIASDFQYADSITIHESEYCQAFSCYLHKLKIQSRNSTYFNRK